jgi:hypothetical protein
LEEFPNEPLNLLHTQPDASYADVVAMFSAR